MSRLDLLSLSDFGKKNAEQNAARALELDQLWRARSMPQTLKGARVGLIAELPGWRNPSACALGVAEMGGTCITVPAGFEGSETVEDLAGYLDNWFDLVAVRTPSLSRLSQFAHALDAPVMNLRTNDNHPCEVLGDLAFVLSRRGHWNGLRVAVVGAYGNIVRSWFEAASVLPIEVVQVAPSGFQYSGPDFEDGLATTDDMQVVRDCDLIVTDCWPPNSDPTERQRFLDYRIDADLLDGCRNDVLFVPCPPVTRGEEVSGDAITHPSCMATPAKAFLLHAQNAYLEQALQDLR